jgi:hypothetical protein
VLRGITHFFGVVEFSSGDRYIGQFSENWKTSGLGLFVRQGGGEHFGFFKEGCVREGFGVAKTVHGEIMEGYWENGSYARGVSAATEAPLEVEDICRRLAKSSGPGQHLRVWTRFQGINHLYALAKFTRRLSFMK